MVTGYGPPRVLFTILAMVPPSKSQMGYENPSEGAVRIAAGHLATRIRASDSEVKQVILLAGSVLHLPRALALTREASIEGGGPAEACRMCRVR